MDRRGFIRTLGALLAAPAVVRASSLMPVTKIITPPTGLYTGQIGMLDGFTVYEGHMIPTIWTTLIAAEWDRPLSRMEIRTITSDPAIMFLDPRTDWTNQLKGVPR